MDRATFLLLKTIKDIYLQVKQFTALKKRNQNNPQQYSSLNQFHNLGFKINRIHYEERHSFI
jgi:hypothetical protein